MARNLFICTVLGGIVLFLWSFVSHVFLPWYPMTMSHFQDEDRVAETFRTAAPESGVYVYPDMVYEPGMTGEERAAVEETYWKKMEKGPIIFAAVKMEGSGSPTPRSVTWKRPNARLETPASERPLPAR